MVLATEAMGVVVHTRKTLAILSGTVATLGLVALGFAVPSGGSSGYPPVSIPGSPDVAPGHAVILNPQGVPVVAKLAATSGSSVSISAGSLGLGLGGTYSTSVTYNPSTKTVTLSNGVTVNLHGLGLKPGSIVVITLYSSGTVIGRAVVAADGTYSVAVVIPPGISQGNHTIAESATAKNGRTVKVSLGIKIAAPKNVTVGPFVSGAQLSSGLATQVNRLALVVKSQHVKSVHLTGYTDSTGGRALNIKESQLRAKSVAAQLSADLAALHVAGVKIGTSGAGEAHPVTHNKTAAGRIKNRRVVATLS